MNSLSCFKKYDIRGVLGDELNTNTVYSIGRAVAEHFLAKKIVVGYDSRETSSEFALALSSGIRDSGSDVLSLGMSGTEEVYWAVTEYDACAGVEITASHNPINYNGMKLIKAKSKPLDEKLDFNMIKGLAEKENWKCISEKGSIFDVKKEARDKYVKKVLSFVDLKKIRSLRVLVNCGNGTAGPVFDEIEKELSRLKIPLEFIKRNHNPDHTFPNGIPNPLLPDNQRMTSIAVREEQADIGIAFDGDFDRCFLFDHKGHFVSGSYLVGLIASIFLKRETNAAIIHDSRVVWNIQDIIRRYNGISIQSKTGHNYIKQAMRDNQAIYGGEISAHHYFRDFAYCDSGMIPWLLVTELMSISGKSLSALIEDRVKRFPSSNEINFVVSDPEKVIEHIISAFDDCKEIETVDGVSLSFSSWRMNLRKSNTEPLLRLNIEVRGPEENLSFRIDQLTAMIEKYKIS